MASPSQLDITNHPLALRLGLEEELNMSITAPVAQQKAIEPIGSLERTNFLWIAWGAMLLVSALPNIVFLEGRGSVPSWLIWAKIGGLLGLVLLGFVWQAVRSLRAFFIVLAAIYLAQELFFRVSQTDWWQWQFNYAGVTFRVTMLSEQGLRLAVSLAIIVTLLLLGFRRADIFLIKGQLDAPAAPVRLFGMKATEPWTHFGWRFLLGAILALGIFLGIAAWPMLGRLPQALPLLPAVFVLALFNAFNEELVYRAALLAPLHKVIGDHQAIYLAALFFGLGHYTGVPYGVTGVLMATFLGWALGKAMIETRGFFWSWSIHFVMDVMIFSLMAVGSITAGGR
ncbi:MAG: CPBP family intramembrane metalloprotease [Chloroflexi bacterium]|nr:CPBP family intramembrane metalloprotease [Chloroflexota bacterium]